MLNIMCTVEHATWTIISATHRFIQMSGGGGHEDLVKGFTMEVKRLQIKSAGFEIHSLD